MELAAGPATSDVTLGPLLDGARRYEFFQLVELLHRHHEDNLERGANAGVTGSARVHYKATASLGFPGSDVVALTPQPSGHYDLEISFFGLQGAQSPLPGYYLEALAYGAAHREGVAGDFLNFFNHRLLTLMHRSWRKYRHYVRYQDGARDGFSAAVFALLGLADADLRSDMPISWSKMLAYAGLLAGRSRSPEVVCGVLGHSFNIERVEIEQWVLRWVEIPADQRSCVGQRGMRLGESFVAGDRVADVGGKFALCLHGLTLERFRDFLPDGVEHARLKTLIDFVLREPLAYDLELELLESAVRPIRLGEASSCQLGWTTFVNPQLGGAARRRRVRIQMTG